MEALIALLVLVALAIPLLLVIALVMISGLRRRVGALEQALLARDAPVAERSAAVSESTSVVDDAWDPVPAVAPWPLHAPHAEAIEIGRASCRERV